MKPQYNPLKGEAPLEDKSFYSGEYLIKRNIETIPTLLDPIFPRVGSVAIAGSSDLGKSTLLRQLALAVSVGDSSFLGWKLNPIHKSAMVVSTEDFADLMTITLKTFNKEKKLHTSKYQNIHFMFVIENLLEKLEGFIKDNPIDLLVMDAFLDIFDGVMNDGGQVRRFITKYDQLAAKYRFLVVFNHRAGKRTQQFAPSKDNLLGSQSFEAKMRLVIEVRPDLAIDNRLHLCIVKGNYLAPEYKLESYIIESNEHRYFSNTGERGLFEDLREGVVEKKDLKKLCFDLHAEGKSTREIELELRGEGYKISKSTVDRYIKEHK